MEKSPTQLVESIVLRIRREEIKQARIRFALWSFFAIFAIGAFIPAWNELQIELTQSGFSQFISLIFSDFSSSISLWKEWSFSLLESLPALGVAAVLTSFFALLFSLRGIIKNSSIITPVIVPVAKKS